MSQMTRRLLGLMSASKSNTSANLTQINRMKRWRKNAELRAQAEKGTQDEVQEGLSPVSESTDESAVAIECGQASDRESDQGTSMDVDDACSRAESIDR